MDSITLLKKLITFRTTADRIGELEAALNFIEKILKPQGLWIQRLTLKGPNRPVMYACTKKIKRPEILIVPHLDVVEGEADQFKPFIKGQKLFGRGACDCKNHVTVAIQALIHAAKKGKSVGAFFTTDEEIGGPTTSLLLSRGFNGKKVIMLDTDLAIVFRQKGILNLKVVCRGKSGHGSMPWLGINANEKLLRAYEQIKKLFPATTVRDRWKATVNLGLIRGGDVINKIADYAEMLLNIRLTEKGDHRKLIKAIRAVKEVDQVEILSYTPFYSIDPGKKEIQEFKKIMEQSLGTELRLDSMHGATDAHNFAPYKSLVIITGTGFGGNFHGRDEWIEIPGLLRFEKALCHYIDLKG
ncbi:MAG: M20 family metallopeptidase [Deltaproteobacteria bacterium]|nr:M20 family metallopeptidase [Deltaproteobacteria bacterium]